MSDIADAILNNATGPKSVQGDEATVTQHSISEQIEADRYLRNKEVSNNPAKALKLVKLVPPGTV